jgi:Cd2+/Zn2+-exporting ATPase
MGGVGSDAAIEAADVVLMTDEPTKLVTAIKIARKTRSVIWQNIFFAFAVKAAVLLLGAGGLATIWEAVFADVGVALLAVLNAVRTMRVRAE